MSNFRHAYGRNFSAAPRYVLLPKVQSELKAIQKEKLRDEEIKKQQDPYYVKDEIRWKETLRSIETLHRSNFYG